MKIQKIQKNYLFIQKAFKIKITIYNLFNNRKYNEYNKR